MDLDFCIERAIENAGFVAEQRRGWVTSEADPTFTGSEIDTNNVDFAVFNVMNPGKGPNDLGSIIRANTDGDTHILCTNPKLGPIAQRAFQTWTSEGEDDEDGD